MNSCSTQMMKTDTRKLNGLNFVEG